MEFREISTIKFVDADSGQEALAIVRTDGTCTGLCLSLKDDGDVEVFMNSGDLRALYEALEKAVHQVSGNL